MKFEREKEIPEKKLQIVSELEDLIKNKKTIVIASIKGISGSQYQEIVKGLRGMAIVKVPKKSLIFRALDSAGNDAVKKLKEHFKESSSILFSDIDSFDLAAELISKKTPARAKAGQEAPEDIEIEPGPTDLVPGPAISELGALGIQIQIEKGKIHIKEAKVIAKAGEKISEGAADIMGKLDIKPFSVGFTPIAAFDVEEGKLYSEINIDKEKVIEDLKYGFGRALPFAVSIGYTTPDTIKFIIGKAGSHGKALGSLDVKETKESEVSEKNEEPKNDEEDTQDKTKSKEEK